MSERGVRQQAAPLVVYTTKPDARLTLLERSTVDPLVQVNGVFTSDHVVKGGPGLLGLRK